MLAEIDIAHIGLGHRAVILLQKFLRQGAEGVQLHAGHQLAIRILLSHCVYRGTQLRRRMCKVLIHGTAVAFLHQLQSLARTTEGGYRLVEQLVIHAQRTTYITGRREVEQVVASEHTQRSSTTVIGNKIRDAVHYLILRHIVWHLHYVRTIVGFRHLTYHRIICTIDQSALSVSRYRLYLIDKLRKLVLVYIKCRKHIDMIPLDACNHCYIRFIDMELWATVDRRSQIFVAFYHHNFCSLTQSHHHLEAFQLRTNHIVGFDAGMCQHVQYHRRGRCLAVRAAYHHTSLVFRLLVEILWVAVNSQSEFLRTQQLGVVDTGMHTQHYRVEIVGYPLWMPALFFGQQPVFCQTAFCRVEYLVVRTRDVITFQMQRDCKIMHRCTAYSNKMYVHYFC